MEDLKVNPIDCTIPKEDPLYGEYVAYGVCPCCGATRFINDTRASIIATRPQIIYTCEDRMCPGRMQLDPYWTPRSFNIPLQLPS